MPPEGLNFRYGENNAVRTREKRPQSDMNENHPCPLCGGAHVSPYHRDGAREYVHCRTCDLVFVPSQWHISVIEAKAYYDLHDNRPDDPGYRRFLGRLFDPLNQRLPARSTGLDFGCGPGPALAHMFTEAGHKVALYDPFYAPDPLVLSARYDFITLSEVAEHLSRPGPELDRLWTALKPGGILGIMTKRVRDQAAFATWHYITDPTHIAFFSQATFAWLCQRWTQTGAGASLSIAGDDVVLIEKS